MIELDRISIGFPNARGEIDVVVRNLTLTLAPGKRVGMVGESGSGKSLTALACLGLVPEPGRIVDGSVTLDGESPISMAGTELQRWRGGSVGFVFQEATSALNPVYTVGYQLEEAIRCHRGTNRSEARRVAVELLRRSAVDEADRVLHAYPHELSGGLAQRVMLAIALAGEPKILIADEPTSSLDSVTQAEILALLDNQVRERGLGLLLISHDLAVVREAVDRVVVMAAGEIVEEGPTKRVFDDPHHPLTRKLLSSAGRRLPTEVTGARA